MGILARDTDRRAEMAQIAILRGLPACKKLELLDDACETTRSLMLAGLRARFPNSSEADLQRRLMALLVGEETAVRVWGPPSFSER